jgi:hypothetical protein
MEISPQHKYNFEKNEHGMKGGMHISDNETLSHLSIPVGVIIVQEHNNNLPMYVEDNTSEYKTIDQELFDKLLEKCSQQLGKDSTQKSRKMNSKTKKIKKELKN